MLYKQWKKQISWPKSQSK